MSSTRSQIVDYTYDDPRTGERVRERRIQEVPPDEMEEIRTRELAIFNGTRSPSRERDRRRDRDDRQGSGSEDEERYYAVRRTTQRGGQGRDWRRGQAYDPPPLGRRNRSQGYGEGCDRDRSNDQRYPDRRYNRETRRNSRDRRARSEDDSYDRLWYSMKKRRDGNVLERNFDSSYDGIIAGVAGAALGAVTARDFGGQKNKKWKMVGGAVAGAAATNAAENWYRLYVEERQERKENKG